MESAVGYDAFGARDRVERVVAVLGNNVTAELLGVSKSQPSKWRRGTERVSAESFQRLLDLDYVVTRLLMTWQPPVALEWLNGHNPHLNGRPIDVMRRRGPLAIMPALNAQDAGAHA